MRTWGGQYEISSLEQAAAPTDFFNFVHYPQTKEGEFISLSLMKFDEVIDKSRDWDGKTTYISENELFMSQDLTENDIVIRQINCSKIVDRLLRESLRNQNIKSG